MLLRPNGASANDVPLAWRMSYNGPAPRALAIGLADLMLLRPNGASANDAPLAWRMSYNGPAPRALAIGLADLMLLRPNGASANDAPLAWRMSYNGPAPRALAIGLADTLLRIYARMQGNIYSFCDNIGKSLNDNIDVSGGYHHIKFPAVHILISLFLGNFQLFHSLQDYSS